VNFSGVFEMNEQTKRLKVLFMGLMALFIVPVFSCEAGQAPKQGEKVVVVGVPDIVIGDENAPITIYEYSSLTCAACALFHQIVVPYLQEHYMSKGLVKIVFSHFPLDHVALQAAQVVSSCVQGKQGEVLQALYVEQDKWLPKSLDDLTPMYKEFARIAKVDLKYIRTCVANKTIEMGILYTRLVTDKKIKIEATPAFIIDNKKYEFALTPKEVDDILKPLVAKLDASVLAKVKARVAEKAKALG